MAETTHFIHDSVLGHVPNPGFRSPGFGGSFHTIDSQGIRFSGQRPVSRKGAILAVGDSFTYGDEVLDEESWPAQLQRLTGRPVLNGGVTGYGFDQIVLRTEQLAARYDPSLVIVGFIADDIRRVEMRRLWWRDKPWFAIDGGRLVLKGVPVPNRSILPLGMRRRMDSVLVDCPPLLQALVGYNVRVHRHGQGLAIAQRLVERLVRLQAERGARIVVMAQYPPVVWVNPKIAGEQREATRAILDRAAGGRLAVLDTFARLATEPKPLAFYGFSHMNARGNLMIASLLAAALPGLLQQPSTRSAFSSPADADDPADQARKM